MADTRTIPVLDPDILRIRDPVKVCRRIKDSIQEVNEQLGTDGVLVPYSGGLDSTVTLILSVQAVGAGKTKALSMPDKESSRQHLRHVEKVVQLLGVNFERIDITPIVKAHGGYRQLPLIIRLFSQIPRIYYKIAKRIGQDPFGESLGGSSYEFIRRADVAFKTKHRVRLTQALGIANAENLTLINSANGTEGDIGFYSFGGIDHVGHITPIGNLYKTQVYQIAEHLKRKSKLELAEVLGEIIKKPPSPDLISGITDEYIVGPYQTIDLILVGLKSGLSSVEIATQLDLNERYVQRVHGWTKKADYLKKLPIIPNLQPI